MVLVILVVVMIVGICRYDWVVGVGLMYIDLLVSDRCINLWLVVECIVIVLIFSFLYV